MVFLFTRKKIQLWLTKLDRGGFINYNAVPVLCDVGYDTLSLADGIRHFMSTCYRLLSFPTTGAIRALSLRSKPSGAAAATLLTSGDGDDFFVFADGHCKDRVTDFAVDDDVIDLSAVTNLADFNDILAAATAEAEGTLMKTGGTSQIGLESIFKADLTETNFLFS